MGFLPGWAVFVGAAIRLLGGAAYATAAWKGKARPNPVTWFFWALTPLVVFVVQVLEGDYLSAVMSLALALSPLAVFIIGLVKHTTQAQFNRSTVVCATLATVGLVLWMLTDDPVMAIAFSIATDLFASIPTLIKCYRYPKTEKSLTFALSMVSIVITAFAVDGWDFTSIGFLAYMFGINVALFGLVQLGRQAAHQNRRRRRSAKHKHTSKVSARPPRKRAARRR